MPNVTRKETETTAATPRDCANAKPCGNGHCAQGAHAPVTSPGRRRFLDYLLGTGALATLGAVLYPVFRFMSPPQVVEAAQNSVEVGKVSSIAPNSGKIFKFGSKPGIIIKTEAGELKALSAVCTHLECIVQYRPDTKQVWCACHNGQYNVNGKNVGGPPPRPLEEYAVNLRGDDIIVTKT